MNQPNKDNTASRVNVSAKSMINSKADVNQLVPFKYPWAWAMYLKSSENHWMPQETGIDNLKDRFEKASPEKQQIIKDLLGCIGPREMVLKATPFKHTGKDRDDGIDMLFMYRHNTAPECRQYLLRQGFEEVIKSHTYSYLSNALELTTRTPVEVTQNTWDLIHNNGTGSLEFSTESNENAIRYIKFLIDNVIVNKGYSDLYAFQKMLTLKEDFPDLLKLFGFVFRDSVNHVQFAIRVINAIFEENPQLDRYDSSLVESLVSVHESTPYAIACLEEYRMAIQPMYRPNFIITPKSFGLELDTPAYKQHLAEDSHTSSSPTSVGSLDW